ncbi:protein shisa-9 isoform X3 [Lagopus muta]|nr:protein shisa-9 isoform X3 [Lagopus muta]XP_048818305.1 protein shisa-9 isoform X3 [Lagopus muta]
MEGFVRLLFGYLVADLLTLVCRAQEKAGQQLGSFVVLSGGNRSSLGEQPDPSEPPPTPDFCRGYFDVMGQWDPPFNCSSGEFIFCCGTCGFRFCCKFKKTRLDQSTCTNYETPLWMNTGKPPSRIDDPLHDPTRDKTNLIVYIICGVVAVMVLVGIFTKLGLEKAHRPQREHMSRALADVMRPQGPCTTDHMERDLNIVVHVQHYENMETRPPPNNLPLQPIQVLLNGSTAFRCVSQSSQLRIIGKLAEGGHYPLIKVTDEDVEQDRTQHRPLRNTAAYRPPTGLCTTTNDPLCSASQPVLNPPHCPLIYPTLPQLCYKDVMGDSIKCLAEIKVDYIHCSPPIHPARDNIIEGYQVGQARPPPCEPVLTTPDNLLFFQLSGDDIQYKLFHHHVDSCSMLSNP